MGVFDDIGYFSNLMRSHAKQRISTQPTFSPKRPIFVAKGNLPVFTTP